MKTRYISKETTIAVIWIWILVIIVCFVKHKFIWWVISPPIFYLLLWCQINTLGYKTEGLWWFRIFGYGIAWKNKRKHHALYSERNGFSWKLRIGNWRFKFLKP